LDVRVYCKGWNRIRERPKQHWYDTALPMSFQEKFAVAFRCYFALEVDTADDEVP